MQQRPLRPWLASCGIMVLAVSVALVAFIVALWLLLWLVAGGGD